MANTEAFLAVFDDFLAASKSQKGASTDWMIYGYLIDAVTAWFQRWSRIVRICLEFCHDIHCQG